MTGFRFTHRLHSSSFLGFVFRILQGNPKKELLWSLWVGHSLELGRLLPVGRQPLPTHTPVNSSGSSEVFGNTEPSTPEVGTPEASNTNHTEP